MTATDKNQTYHVISDGLLSEPLIIPADELTEDDLFDDCPICQQLKAEMRNAASPFRRSNPKVGRNAQCFCGSGRKYKICCGSTAN